MKKYEKEVIQAQLDNEKAVLEKIEQNYNDALDDINGKIADLMGRADADQSYVVYQVEYQRALKAQIESVLLQLQTNEFETVSEYLKSCYEEGFLGSMYSLQKQGIPLVIPMDQKQIVAAVMLETKLSHGLYKTFDTKELQKKIAAEISRGFSAGTSYSEIARNVSAYAGISKNNANRIVRTEGHRIIETASYHAQEKSKDRGADLVRKWDAKLDGKTRPSHFRIDGEIREIGERFSNGLLFPGDTAGSAAEVINCRCSATATARWALDSDETKILGDTSKMSDSRKKEIADKLGIPVDDIDLYSDQVVPINAKNYADFKRQYNKLWRYEGSELQQQAEARIAKLEKNRNAEGIAKAGRVEANGRFVNSNEKLYRYAEKVKPLDGFEDFTCHANANEFYIDTKGNGNEADFVTLSPSEYAEAIKNSNIYKGGNVRILSCQAGAKEDGAAQKLADAMQVAVYAPTEIVNIDENGNMFISDNDILAEIWYNASEKEREKIKETGKWTLFLPRKE